MAITESIVASNGERFIVYQGTWYKPQTLMKVIEVLNDAFLTKTRIVVEYGNTTNGAPWPHTASGYVSRSTGTIKAPLLCYNKRSLGGSIVWTENVLSIKTSQGKRVLYQWTKPERSNVYTVDDVMAMGPCYTREKVESLFNGRVTLTVLDVFDLDIYVADKIWILTREGVLSKTIKDKWIEGIVLRAVTNHALHCGIAVVEQWAQRWVSGEDRSRAAANAANAYAANAAAAHAANAAANAAHAANAAANDAAYAANDAAYAANDAAYAAYDAAYAAYDAAYAAERKLQFEDLRTLLNGGQS